MGFQPLGFPPWIHCWQLCCHSKCRWDNARGVTGGGCLGKHHTGLVQSGWTQSRALVVTKSGASTDAKFPQQFQFSPPPKKKNGPQKAFPTWNANSKIHFWLVCAFSQTGYRFPSPLHCATVTTSEACRHDTEQGFVLQFHNFLGRKCTRTQMHFWPGHVISIFPCLVQKDCVPINETLNSIERKIEISSLKETTGFLIRQYTTAQKCSKKNGLSADGTFYIVRRFFGTSVSSLVSKVSQKTRDTQSVAGKILRRSFRRMYIKQCKGFSVCPPTQLCAQKGKKSDFPNQLPTGPHSLHN